jgi:hypothetical protein
MNKPLDGIRVGWGAADLTPDQPVMLAGQFYARVSEGIMDPVTATALVLESVRNGQVVGRVILVSCDLVAIPDGFRDAVRAAICQAVPGLDPLDIFLSATHSHAAPEVRMEGDTRKMGGGPLPLWPGVDLPVMDPPDCVALCARRISEAVARAWASRAPGAFGFGLGHAVVGHNRRISYRDGVTRMYGKTNDPLFSHVEGAEDNSVNVMGFWTPAGRLTGLVVNVACPSQTSEHSYLISADYWHDARQELRRRFGPDVFILAQNSAAGDQSPHILLNKPAEERMWRLMERTQRQDLAVRIADAVTGVLPYIQRDLSTDPVLIHRAETIELSRRNLTEQDVAEASAEADKYRKRYEALLSDLDGHPEKRQAPRWYTEITQTYRLMRWNEGVGERYKRQQTEPTIPFEIHVMRLGEVALATNPFEYYLDFGLRIKARSKAVQTFLVQHVGLGTYVPSERAVAGGSYGALPASTPVGPEGGQELVERTVELLNGFWTV